MLKIYIVTFKRNDILNRNLKSLWASLSSPDDVVVTVLANHPEVIIEPENQRKNLTVRINETRATNAWGYLSRDWNFCLLDAFRDSENPNKTSWAVLAQNDVVWNAGWDRVLLNETRYDFITQPRGDQMMAFRIEAVRQIGFFDERFFTLHFQELDYFYRAILCHPARVSINDDHIPTDCKWNPFEHALIQPTHSVPMDDDQLHTSRSARELGFWLCHKWHIKLELVHHICTCCAKFRKRRRLPTEINWYPFFWKQKEPCFNNFLVEYNSPPLSVRLLAKNLRRILREYVQGNQIFS